jgi:hypothetical protein
LGLTAHWNKIFFKPGPAGPAAAAVDGSTPGAAAEKAAGACLYFAVVSSRLMASCKYKL